MNHRENFELKISDNLEVSFTLSQQRLDQTFCFFSFTDRDAGGWIVSEVHRNLKLCIDDKSERLRKNHNFIDYQERWLLLIDEIGYSLSEHDRKTLLSLDRVSSQWDRIIIVDPTNPTNYFEL